MAPTKTNPELDALLATRRSELEEAQKPSPGGAILRTGTGAGIGLIAGAGATLTAVAATGANGLRNFFRKNKNELKALEQEYAAKPVPEAIHEKLRRGMMEEMDKALAGPGLAAGICRNPDTAVLGMAIAGGAMGYAWHRNHHQHKVEAAEQEVAMLDKVKASWAERAEHTPAESAERGK